MRLLYSFFMVLGLLTTSYAQQLSLPVVMQRLYQSYSKINGQLYPEILDAANDDFQQKLLEYGRNYPGLLQQSFDKFKNLNVATSDDHLLRIYSWDTWTGGTMHFFANVIQYKTANTNQAFIIPNQGEGDPGYYYPLIITVTLNDKTYYLVSYKGIYSTKDAGEGIKVFTIENGKLNTDVKLIKTQSGLHSQLYYNYNFLSVVDWKVRPSIRFDKSTNFIYVPLVTEKGIVTHRFIIYKFTGQHFELVKS